MITVRRFISSLTVIGAVSALATSMVACGGDDDSSGSGGSGSGSTTTSSGTPSATSGGPSSSGSATTSAGTGTPGECTPNEATIQTCKDEAANQMQCAEVGNCACDHCVCELAQCEFDAGCKTIRECAQRTNCTGIGCYSPPACQSEIDTAGGPLGPSASLALTLSTCIEMNACPLQCP